MAFQKFDLAKLERLNDEGRFETLIPEVMWAALGSPSPDVIVDIGAGTGLFSKRFARLAPGAVVYAIDTEPVMLSWIDEHPDPEVAGRIRTVLADVRAIPLPDEIADLAVMINLHHELADPPASYREALRLLRPGGRMLVVDWSPGDLEGGPPQAIRASGEQIASMLTAAGFAETTVHGGLPKHSIVVARKIVP